jgi:hypothetical protein
MTDAAYKATETASRPADHLPSRLVGSCQT